MLRNKLYEKVPPNPLAHNINLSTISITQCAEHTKTTLIPHPLTATAYINIPYTLYGRPGLLIVAINKPVPFIKAIKSCGVVAPGLSKLGEKVVKYQRITQIRD